MMDKARLRNIIRPEAREEYFSQARTNPEYRYLAELKQYNDILQIAFFPTKGLIKGWKGADARIFVSADDYITQDLKTAKTKWLKGRVDYATHFEWNYRKPWLGDIGFVDAESREMFINRFGDTKSPRYSNPWPNLYHWQSEVLERKRKDRYNRELTETEEYMGLIKGLPEDFHDWMRTVGINQATYLIYDAASKKKEKLAFCTVCKQYHRIDDTDIILRNYEKAICPGCGSEVECRSHGRIPDHFKKDCWLCLMQPVYGGFVARYFSAHFHYHFSRVMDTDLYVWEMTPGSVELCRDFYIGSSYIGFEYRVYKQFQERWCPENGSVPCARAIVYTKNLSEILKDTPYRYSALDVFQEKSGYRDIPIYRYLNNFSHAPCLEYFVKSGLVKLTDNIVNHGQGKHINLKSKDRKKIIDLPAAYIRQLVRLNGGKSMVELLWTFAVRYQNPPKDDFVSEWHQTFGEGTRQIRAADAEGISLSKFLNYIKKQRKKYSGAELERCGHARYYSRPSNRHEKYRRECTNVAIDWEDYIGFCRQLHINLDDEYNLLPPDLKQAHDRLAEELQRIKDEKERKAKALMEKNINKILVNMQSDNPYEMAYGGLFIAVPRNAEDIRREGELQHHCVATYINRVAQGQTMILFIRQKAAPEEPFYTLEYRDGKVIQCRGKRNCDMTAKVETFVKAFEKMMQEKEDAEKVRIRVEAS